MEATSRKFEVLGGLKFFLKFEELYPANWFTPTIRAFLKFCYCSFLSFLFLFIITTIWLCADAEWDLTIISGPMSFLLGSFQIMFIYADIFNSKLIIVDSTDSLQRLVQDSNAFNFITFYKKYTKQFY